MRDQLLQARNAVSQCDLAAEQLKKLVNTPTARELDLQQRRGDLCNPSIQGNEANRSRLAKEVEQIEEQIADERASKFESLEPATEEHTKVYGKYVALTNVLRLPRRLKALSLDEPEKVLRTRTTLLRLCITELSTMIEKREDEDNLTELEEKRRTMKTSFPANVDPRFAVAQLEDKIEKTKAKIESCENPAERLAQLTSGMTEIEPTEWANDE